MQPLRLHIMVPHHVSNRRAAWLRHVLANIQAARTLFPARTVSGWRIELVLNWRADEPFIPAWAAQATVGLPGDVSVIATVSASKIDVVNRALERARQWDADAFICVDDDVWFQPDTLCELVRTFVHSGRSPVGIWKAPLVPVEATEFQRLYSYAVLVSHRYGINQKRLSGSMYCVDPGTFDCFPDPCNEGDVLSRMNAVTAPGVIYSPYPQTEELEIARQMRLRFRSTAAGVLRILDQPQVIESRLPAGLIRHDIDRERYRRSVELWYSIRRAAAELDRLLIRDRSPSQRPSPQSFDLMNQASS